MATAGSIVVDLLIDVASSGENVVELFVMGALVPEAIQAAERLLDRGVYATLDLRLARHPSETAEFLVTRLLAYCLEYEEGISFGDGVSTQSQQEATRCWHHRPHPHRRGTAAERAPHCHRLLQGREGWQHE